MATVAVIAASAIGLIMAMQSASLLTGTSTQWTGAAICVAAGVGAYVLRSSVPRAARVIAVLAAIVALGSVAYLESQMADKREEIGNLFSTY